MIEETSEEYVASCLRAIESPSFDEEGWVKMALDIVPQGMNIVPKLSHAQRQQLQASLMMSPMVKVGMLYSFRFILLNSASAVAAFGKNPMVPLWLEANDPDFLRCTDVSMRKTLSQWNDDFLKTAYREEDFHKLIDVLLQDSFVKMMKQIHGDANIFENHGIASMHQDLQDDIDIFFSKNSTKPETCLEMAMTGHALLLALCKAFETPVPENLFSSLEEP